MGVIGEITTTDSNTHLIASTAYATCDTAKETVAKVATIHSNHAFTLMKGITVHVKFAATNTASSPTLNVNSTGAYPIKAYGTTAVGTTAATSWQAGAVVSFTFIGDGTNDNYWLMNDYIADTSTTNATQIQLSGGVKSGTSALTAKNIIVANNDGLYKHLKTGTAFDINQPILYLSAACAANTATTSVYIEINIAINTTQSLTLTAYKPLYIKGTLAGNIFTPISTAPITQTEPSSSSDEYYYLYLGYAYSTTAFHLTPHHPIYRYDIYNGFGLISTHAITADSAAAADEAGSCVIASKANALSNTTAVGNFLNPVYFDANGLPVQTSSSTHMFLPLMWTEKNKTYGSWFYTPASINLSGQTYEYSEITAMVYTTVGSIYVPIHIPIDALSVVSATSISTAAEFRGGWSQTSSNGGSAYIKAYIDSANDRIGILLDKCYVNGSEKNTATVTIYKR